MLSEIYEDKIKITRKTLDLVESAHTFVVDIGNNSFIANRINWITKGTEIETIKKWQFWKKKTFEKTLHTLTVNYSIYGEERFLILRKYDYEELCRTSSHIQELMQKQFDTRTAIV